MTDPEQDFVLSAADVRFARDDDGRVQMTLGSDTQTLGSIMSAFPLTHPGHMVSLRDLEGQEIGVLDNVRELDERSRDVVREELERTYFMPKILDIHDVREELNVVTWEVDTNRGSRTFEVRNVRQNVRRVGRRRLVIKDVDGNRYEIRDWIDLPPHAQKLIELYL